MQIRYHELLGRRVLAVDGQQVGTIEDLVAEPVNGQLCVTALLVGFGALARRIAFRRAPWLRVDPPRRIPWSAVARIGEHVHLASDCGASERVDDCEVVPAAEPAPQSRVPDHG